MKRLLITISFFLLIGIGLFAQSNVSDYYVRSVPIERIYHHADGYRIVYLRSNMQIAVIHVPLDWLRKPGGKGQLVQGEDPSYPYFSVFYENGEFSHVRIYVKKDLRDPSWGDLDPEIDISDRFQIETLDVKY